MFPSHLITYRRYIIPCIFQASSKASMLIKNTTNSSINKYTACMFSTSNFSPLHAKKTIPFVYVREKKPPSILNSGENEPLKEVDLSKPILEFKDCQNLENIDEKVQKLISLKYAPRREIFEYLREEYVKLVRRHPLDSTSSEAKIASLTVKIRYFQKNEYLQRNAKMRVQLLEMIDKRKKLLKNLRKDDYNRFQWLLEVLQITYTPPPLFYHWTTRKGTIRNLTREHCTKLRKQKIDEFRAKLKAQQAEFLDEKEKTLEWIKQVTEELQLTPEESAYVEQQLLPFNIPIFPKYLNHKYPILEHIKLSKE